MNLEAPGEDPGATAVPITPFQSRRKGEVDSPQPTEAPQRDPTQPEATKTEGTRKEKGVDVIPKASPNIHSDMNSSTTGSGALCVTAEKCLDNEKDAIQCDNANDKHHHGIVASISCPDGTKVELTSDCSTNGGTDDGIFNKNKLSSVILGRGKWGVPSSAIHVDPLACAVRIVKMMGNAHEHYGGSGQTDEQKSIYGLELAVVGSQPCRITRTNMNTRPTNYDSSNNGGDKNATSTTSFQVSSPLTQNDFGHTTCLLVNGDVVEPYYCKDGVQQRDEFEKAEKYLPFVVNLDYTKGPASGSTPDGTAFVEASKRIRKEEENMTCPNNAVKKALAESRDTSMANRAEVGLQKNPRLEAVSADDAGKNNADGADTANSQSIKSHVATTAEQMGEDQKHSPETNQVVTALAVPVAVASEEGGGTQESSTPSTTMGKEAAKEASVSDMAEEPAQQESVQESSASTKTDQSSEEDHDATKETSASVSDMAKKPAQQESVQELSSSTETPQSAEEDHAVTKEAVASVSDMTEEPAQQEAAQELSSSTEIPQSFENDHDTTKEAAASVSDTAKKPAQQESIQELSSSTDSDQSSEEDHGDIDNPREEVLEILQGVDSPGSFATGGSCGGHLIMPGIEVDGIGIIGLPLAETQAQSLAARCEQAPFGRGSKTIVDTSVRKTFQLAPEHFKITNPGWDGEISNLLSSVRRDLGVQDHLKVEAQLYKMLLYEEGSFFAMHRDSEKVDGMFGTLVVVLPTGFTGGELVVKHQGQIKEFAQSQSSGFGSQYVSFYADCKHELKPVTSGNRLCLVYNLVKTGAGECPRAQRNRKTLRRLKHAVQAWAGSFDGNKLVIMTEHLYTPAGIVGGGRSGTGSGGGSAKFKGNDAAVVDLLEQAVEEGIDVDWDHGTLSFSESGYGEDDGYGDYYGRYSGSGSFTWCETTDSELSLVLSSWGDVSVDTDEIEPEDYWEGKEPEDETFQPTGNEGVNAERQYADEDAIVVWPRSQRWIVATNNDTDRMCSYLLKACTPGTNDSESKTECIAKAQTIVGKIVSSRSSSSRGGYSYTTRENDSQSNVSTLLRALIQLGDQATAMDFVSKYVSATADATPDFLLEELLPLLYRFGADAVRPHMLAAVDQKRCPADPTKTAQFVLKCCRKMLQTKSTCANLATDTVVAFVDGISPADNSDRRPPTKTLDNFPLKDVLQLFYSDSAIPNGGTLARRIIDYIVWASCQQIKEQPRNSWSTAHQTISPKGPTLLLHAGLTEMLESLPRGWAEFGPTLSDAVEKMCMHGSNGSAVEFVEGLANQSPVNNDSDRAQVYGRLASLVCERMLTRTARLASNANAPSVLASYKRLFQIIARYCPSQARLFATTVDCLDVDSILIPLVTDNTIRDIAGGRPGMKEALDSLTKHCANVISSRTLEPLSNVKVWTLSSHIPLPRNSQYLGFLKNPCRRVLNWKVRKSDHKGFFADLAALIRAGEVKAESYQPGGRGAYHFRITKLKRRTITMSSFVHMTCNCSSSSNRSNYRYGYGHSYSSSASTNSNCLLQKHKATVTKRKQDERTLSSLMQLLPQEQREQVGTRKRQASSSADGTAAAATDNAHLTACPRGSAAAAASSTSSSAKKQKHSSSAEVIDLT